MKSKKAASRCNPSKLRFVVSFDERFPEEYDALFATKDGRLFLTDGCDDGVFRGDDRFGKPPVSLKEAVADDFHEITLREALLWYAGCARFSTSGCGNASLLCKLAAEALSAGKEVA